jgi:hypothetical protein
MGNESGSSRLDIAQEVLKLDLDIARQKRIIAELEQARAPCSGAKTLLRLLEETRRELAAQL